MHNLILRAIVRNRRAILEAFVLTGAGVTGCFMAEILYRFVLPFAHVLPE